MIVSSILNDTRNNIGSDSTVEDLLLQVQKPARYTGHEVNAVIRDPSSIKLHMGLCFPDVYEVGMSHLGLKILYSIVNGRSDLYAERAFAPWSDMEAAMRLHGIPLCTLETGTRCPNSILWVFPYSTSCALLRFFRCWIWHTFLSAGRIAKRAILW